MSRLLPVAVIATAVLALGAGATALAGVVPGYPHSHHCPSFELGSGTFRDRFQVTVLKGNVSCPTARRVLRDFLSGKGKLHGPPDGPLSEQSWTLDGGWSCGHGAGGGACIHGGASYKVAKQFITANAEP
jgi:hypothetical protein